jgi:magnesium-protoporphyrin O-methyltransferase
MLGDSYTARRGALAEYFDRTAVDAWARLTTTQKVSRIRETVRAGRDAMRATLLSFLPQDLSGRRVLDAGCGTGAMAVELARRGAEVLAVDLSPQLLAHAAERLPAEVAPRIRLVAGDMLDPAHGRFDHAVGMDSLIHYRADDMAGMLAGLAARCGGSIVFTFAPRTPALTLMHAAGTLFPRSDRSPAIEPVSRGRLERAMAARPDLAGWRIARTRRISRGFYISEAAEATP